MTHGGVMGWHRSRADCICPQLSDLASKNRLRRIGEALEFARRDQVIAMDVIDAVVPPVRGSRRDQSIRRI